MAKRKGNAQAVYNASGITLVDGDETGLFVDGNGNTLFSSGSFAYGEDSTNNTQGVTFKPASSVAYSPAGAGAFLAATIAVSVKGSAGMIKSVYALNLNAAPRYLQVHNKASAPTAGGAPVFSFYMAALTGVAAIGTEFFGEAGFYLGTGVALAISTTADTYTAATVTDHVLNYTYV